MDRAIRYVRDSCEFIYIYIYIHRVTVKLRGNEESGGNGLNFVRKWEERGRRKKKYRILN